MKNILFIVCFLCSNITLYGMEQNNSDVNYRETEKLLNDGCKTYLNGCLETYKTTDFTPQDMNHILEVLLFITGNSGSREYIHSIKDSEQNGFFQYALNKVDLQIVQWLRDQGNIKYHTPMECEDFLKFCEKQLSPDKEESKKKAAIGIVKCVIEQYKEREIFRTYEETFIRQMIMLQLKERTLSSKYVVDEELLTPFVSQNQFNISDMYQKIMDDECGNTLAHIVVEQRDADELHKLIKKNYISNVIPNKEKLKVHELAFKKFRAFTMDTTSIDLHKKESRASRCCYFMLDKYFAGADFSKKENCCSDHTIANKYVGVDRTQQRQQPVINSFLSIDATSMNLPFPEEPSFFPEEPKKNRCCGWLLTYFKDKQD
jgi:hypothetical protein